MLLFFVAVIGAIVVDTSFGQCPYSQCTCSGTVIDCANRNLTAIPPRLNTGSTYTTLLLAGNKITIINSNSSLPIKLQTLDLSDNPISNITSDSFLAVSQTLKSIKFRNSNFVALPSALEILDVLETLDIEGDSMTFADPTIAKLSQTLKSLRLANLNLIGWPSWIARFMFLQKLYMETNSKLGNPQANIFIFLRGSLTHLSLSNTGTTSLAGISTLQKLQWLDVSNNALSNTVNLSYDLIPFGNTLQYLDISLNSITIEPRLSELRVLTEVHLSSNKIVTINVGAFAPSVTKLYLDHNLLPSVPDFLDELPQLQILSLQKNSITSVEFDDFPVNSRITNLYLGENPLSKIDERAFLNFKSTLVYLNLENTYLTRLPLGLIVLTNLKTLWMPNNERLMCSCDEKAIAPWISNLSNLSVVGQCGYIDITEFVKTLAAHCP